MTHVFLRKRVSSTPTVWCLPRAVRMSSIYVQKGRALKPPGKLQFWESAQQWLKLFFNLRERQRAVGECCV